eukprot:CCRYP_001349-RA/>CCRYP_001349-RA protein AED:0.03 eAED:0.03 QI:702/0.83/0.76/1/0.83/0.84/13/138/1465
MKIHKYSLNMVLFALCCVPSPSDGAGGSSGLRKVPSKTGIECEVQLAVGQTIEGDGLPQEILHCNLDEPDDQGNILYEIKGLEDDEFQQIKSKVMSGGHHRYEFLGATRSNGRPAHANLFGGSSATTQSINVPKLNNGKAQAIEKENRQGVDNGKGHRSLYKLQGVSNVLAVRVVALDSSTSHSLNDCRAHTFGGYDDAGVLDDMNMKSQINACSYGKLKFVEPESNPAYPGVVGGVVTVTLNQNVVGISHGTVLGWLRTQTPLFAGPLDAYDHVMYFMPPGVDFGGAAAFGYVPGRETWYLDSYSLATGVQLHELGHNLGLGHAGEDGAGYGDGSCYMGYGGGDVKMCYNAAKNFYLGWYAEFHQEFNPLEQPSKLYHLVGLSDYEEALSSPDPSAYTIVLHIETFEEESLYLTYNRQEKMNIDVKEFPNKVTVVRANGPQQSWVEAGLGSGQRYSRSIVDGSGLSVEIVVCELVAGSPDYAVVSIHPFGNAPLCTPQSPIPSWDSYNGSLEDSLVAHYTFDSNYLDTSGNRNHAFEFGAPTFISDGAVTGQALSFDGIDDYLELPNIPELDFGLSDFTLTFWYRVSGDQSGRPAIIGNKDWRSPANSGWVVSSNYGSGSNGDDLAINLSDGITTLDGSKAIDVDFNVWHFVAVRVKRGSKMSLLRSDKGSYVLQEDMIGSLTGSLSTNLKIRIGTSHQECGASFTKMDLDDLAIWKRAISSEEVERIWMAGRKEGYNVINAQDSPNSNRSVPRPQAMIAKYDFESDLDDSTSNNLHGALIDGGGMVYSSTNEGYHMNLNNHDFQQKSFVTLPRSSLLDFGTNTSFTMYIIVAAYTPWQDFSSGGPSIISNKDWKSGRNPGWMLGVGADGRYEWNVGDGTNRCDYDGPAATMNDGKWHHVAFSLSRGADGLVTLYFDGKVAGEMPCIVNTVSSSYPINIGTDGRGGAGYPAFFSGDIDKVLIFGSALEHTQLFTLYSQGRSKTGTFAPSFSPTTLSPTMAPTKRPTTSPVTAPPTPAPKGPFFIRNPNTGKLLTIYGGGCDHGTNIVLWQNDQNNWQKWMLNNDNSIESVHCPGMVVGIETSQCGNSVSIVLSDKVDCLGSLSWTVPQDGVMVNAQCDTKAIDISGGSSSNGANLILWSIHGGANQLWEFVNATPLVPTTKPTAIPVTLNPTPKPTTTPMTMKPTSVPSAAPVTLNPTPKPTATPVTLKPTAFPVTLKPTLKPTAAPITLTPSAKPTAAPVTLKPTLKPTAAPVTLKPTAKPTAVAVTQVPTQAPFKTPTNKPVTPAPSIAPTSRPTMKLTASPTSQISSKPSTEAPTKVPTSSPATNPVTSVYIRNPSSGKILSINGGTCLPGTDIVLWKNNGDEYQKWLVKGDGSLESVHCHGMVMDIEGSSCAGKFVKIYNKTNTASQAWDMKADGILRSLECNAGKALDIRHGNTTNGAEIIVYSEHGGWNQRWEMVQAP